MQYIVQPGDTPGAIAQKYLGSASRWREFYQGDPTKLQIGAVLNIPTETPTTQPTIPLSEEERIRSEIAKIREQLEEKTAMLERAKTWESLYPGATPTTEIPEWVLEAKSPEEVKKLITPKRIEELETKAFQTPEKSFKELWDEMYKASKLPDLEAKITKVKEDLYSAENQINENPWLSEAGRVGRIKKLYDMAQKEIDNLTDQYKTEFEKTKFSFEGAYKESQTKKEFEQKELEYLQKKNVPEAQWPKESPTSYKEYILAGGEKGTGLEYADWLKKKMQEKAEGKEKAEVKAQIDMARELQKVRDTEGYISPENWQKAKQAWISAGLDPEKFIKFFYIYINPAKVKSYGVREESYLKAPQGGTFQFFPAE